MGGTSLKVAIAGISKREISIVLDKQGSPVRENYIIPHKNKSITQSFTIYEWMAKRIEEFVSKNRKREEIPLLGALTFSFPLKLHKGEFCVVQYTKWCSIQRI